MLCSRLSFCKTRCRSAGDIFRHRSCVFGGLELGGRFRFVSVFVLGRGMVCAPPPSDLGGRSFRVFCRGIPCAPDFGPCPCLCAASTCAVTGSISIVASASPSTNVDTSRPHRPGLHRHSPNLRTVLIAKISPARLLQTYISVLDSGCCCCC